MEEKIGVFICTGYGIAEALDVDALSKVGDLESVLGLAAVATAQDLPAVADDLDRQRALDNTFASAKVLYEGHPVAAVAAADPQTAEQALRLIEVEYETLPAVIDVLQAAQPGAPLLHEGMTTHSLAGASAAPRP